MAEPELKELHESIQKLHVRFKEVNDKREDELKKTGDERAQTVETLEKVNTRLDEIEVAMKRPGLPSETDPDAKSEVEKAFEAFMRKGADGMTDEQKVAIKSPWVEFKALASDQQDDGGYLVIPVISTNIVEKLIEFSPIRELATTESISTGNTFHQPAEGSGDFGAAWVQERQTAGESATGDIRMVVIPVFEIEARPRVSHQLLEDAAYNVEQWIENRLGRRFGVVEGTAFVNGNATTQPEGLMTNADIGEVNSGNANLVTADGYIDLFYDLPELYAGNSNWIMRRATVGATRKLKDADGQYLWQPGLQAGQPATLLGRPVREAIDMPAVSAGNYPVLFGDFRAGYTIVDRVDMRTLRDPFSAKPNVEFYVIKRVGGGVVLAEAFKKMKISA